MGAKRVLICGGRGGVGTGFIAANLALALCRAQKRVLLIDASPLYRSLDAYFSCEEDVVYDLSDLCAGRAPTADLLLTPPRGAGVSLIAAPFSAGGMPSGITLLKRKVHPQAEHRKVPAVISVDSVTCIGRYDPELLQQCIEGKVLGRLPLH